MIPNCPILISVPAAKRQLAAFAVFFWVLLFTLNVMAQTAPSISYTPSTNVYPLSTAISPLVPSNTGGPVPATSNYAQVTNLVASGFFDQPDGITFDGAGNAYITNMGFPANPPTTPLPSKKVTGIFKVPAGGGTPILLAGTSRAYNVQADGSGTTAAIFNYPAGIVCDGAGNLYVADAGGPTIRKIVISTGLVSTYAGIAGSTGSVDGPRLSARFTSLWGLAIDATGSNLYFTDQYRIRKIDLGTGIVSTLAGGALGFADGTGTGAKFSVLTGLVADNSGNLYVADRGNNAIRKIVISTGVVTTIAGGDPNGGYADGTGAAAKFDWPYGVSLDAAGNILVADMNNQVIRKVTPAGVVTTLAGSGAADVAEKNGTGTAATFYYPNAIATDASGTAYVADYIYGNTTPSSAAAIRKIGLTGYTISPGLPAGLSFDSKTGTISGTPSAASPATNYTVTAYNAYGSSSTIVNIACGLADNWTGFVSPYVWSNAGNWSAGAVPTVANGYIAQIGVVAYTLPNQPTVTADATCGSIVFGTNSSPVLTIAAGKTLTANGGLVVKGAAAIQGPGTISIGGSSSITAAGALTASSTAVISLMSNSTLNNAGTFKLASDATGSATIAAIPLNSSVTGVVTVQRYITGGAGHRGYRFLSSPVNAGSIGGNKVYSINYLLNSVFLTGSSFATTATSKAGNPALYLYRENMAPLYTSFTNSNFRGIGDISASPAYTLDADGPGYNIPVGNGYLFFFRGDKTTVNPYVSTTVPVASTLSATGTLNQGTINVVDWFTPSSPSLSYTGTSPGSIKGFNLLGNPYPGSINFEKFNRNGINSSIYGSGSWGAVPTIYFFNPVSKQYCSYQQNTNAISSPADTTSTINPGNAISSDTFASNMIASGQGFFIQATATGQTFSFRETAKTSVQPTSANLLQFKSMVNASAQQPAPQLRLRLVKDSINTDDVVLSLNNKDSTSYSYDKDALDLGGNGALESLSLLSSDSVKLCIHRRRLPSKTADIIPIIADATTSGLYQLKKIELKNLPMLYDVWLRDAFMKDSLDIKANDTYSFNIDKSNPATFGADRFALVIRQNPAYGYRLLNFSAAKVLNTTPQVQLVWVTENAQYCTNFTVEKSTDAGKTFAVVGTIPGENDLKTYSLLDNHPVVGQNLYRLKQEDINNAISYSPVISIEYSALGSDLSKNAVSVYPNPASNMINLTITPKSSGTPVYDIKLMSSLGILIKEVRSDQLTWHDNVSALLPGMYLIQVTSSKDKSFVGQAKFIKQ